MRTVTYLDETKPVSEHLAYWQRLYSSDGGTIESLQSQVNYLENIVFKLLEVLPREHVAHALSVKLDDIQDS